VGNRFASGKNAIAECDRCGFRFKLTDLKKQVLKTKIINTLVCSTCWDPDHPQLQLGMYPVDDPQGLRNPRPDRSYVTSGLLASGSQGEGSRIFQWGWNPVGGSQIFDAVLTPNDLVTITAVGQVTAENVLICTLYEITVDTTTAGPARIPDGCFANVYGSAVWTIT
jgi:hypothetical protein